MTLHINYISSIGLLFDLFGAFLLYIYGLPSKYDLGTSFTDFDKPDEKNNKRIMRRDHLGIWFIIIGFLFQFIGTNWG